VTWFLDAVAIAVVIAAVAFLLRRRSGRACSGCAPSKQARTAETRIALSSLRAAARRHGARR
jgi:hypothetical protein